MSHFWFYRRAKQFVSEIRLFLGFQFLDKMPPVKKTQSELLREIAKEFPSVFRCEHSVLSCSACDSAVNATQKWLVTQQLKTGKHKESVDQSSIDSSSEIVPGEVRLRVQLNSGLQTLENIGEILAGSNAESNCQNRKKSSN